MISAVTGFLTACYPVVPEELQETRIKELNGTISRLVREKLYKEAISHTEEFITILHDRLQKRPLNKEIAKELVIRSRHLSSLLMLSRQDGLALTRAKAALDLCTRLLATDTEEKISCLNGLATLLIKLKHYEEALTVLNLVLDKLKSGVIAGTETTAKTYDLLAAALEGLKRYEEAYHNLDESFKIKSKIFDGTDQKISQHLEKMARVASLRDATPSSEG